jgi:uncharacterized protein YaiI (UPF0178 family)
VPHIYVDADDCAVKDEVFRVAKRYGLRVTLVANRGMYTPDDERVDMVVVPDRLDAADDWIVENVEADDIVICSDIPLASRCLQKDARAINSRGRCFTDNDMGETLATRDLLKSLREAGMKTSGPKPFGPRDRSQFLQSLDREIVAARKSRRRRSQTRGH